MFSQFKKLICSISVSSKIIFEDARVACPHKGISSFGVKNRMLYTLPEKRDKKCHVEERGIERRLNSLYMEAHVSLSGKNEFGAPVCLVTNNIYDIITAPERR
jgi:hypothetical protein